MKIQNVNSISYRPTYFGNGFDSAYFSKRQIELNNELQKVINESEKPINSSDFLYIMNKKEEFNSRLYYITEQYKELNSITSAIGDDGQNMKIVEEFNNKRKHMNKDTGFNKIIGYQNIKDKLDLEFSIKTILKSQVQEGVNVPNAYLFFGPSGCGKTSFAQALAEQSLSKYYNINAINKDEQEVLDEIIDYAMDSKQNYKNSKVKQRGIIVLNECQHALYEDSPVLPKFEEFIKNCSNEYKCTLFLTANYPLDVSKRILSTIPKSQIIPIPAPDENITRDYFAVKFKDIGADIDIDKVTKELFKNKEKIYSFSDYKNLLERNLAKFGKELNLDTILYIIHSDSIMPSLKIRDILSFENAKKVLQLR